MGMGHLKHLGVEDKFKELYENVDTNKWPGREMCWIWTHPTLAVIIIITGLWEVYLVITRIFL